MPTKTYPGEDTHVDVVRGEDRVVHKAFAMVDAGEAVVHRWLMRYSIIALRISMGAVYLGFGILKYFPGVSPAESLALATTHLLSFGLVPAVISNGLVMVLLATLECRIEATQPAVDSHAHMTGPTEPDTRVEITWDTVHVDEPFARRWSALSDCC